MDNFKEFITEKTKDEPYRLVVLSHDDSYDPNMTGVLLRDKANKLKIDAVLFEFVGAHLHEENNKKNRGDATNTIRQKSKNKDNN